MGILRRSRTLGVWGILAAVAIVFGGSPLALAQLSDQSLFVNAGVAAPASTDPAVVRQSWVGVRTELLREAAARIDSGGTTSDERLDLNLFDDVFLVSALDRLERRGSDRLTWIGHIDGTDDSKVVLVLHKGIVAGSVTTPGSYFQVLYVGPDLYAVREIDATVLPDEMGPLPASLGTDSSDVWTQGAVVDTGDVFDVLVVYTPAARITAGGTAAMEALIALGESETNIAYSNSNIIPTLNVVHSEEVIYNESGNISTDLNRLVNKNDGYMDNVHQVRNNFSADLVKLIVNNGGSYCGVARLMSGNNPLFAEQAFSVTVRSCVSPNYTFGHELGHNMGCNHAPEDPTGIGAYNYSFGHKDPANLFRTVMAYNCSGGGCPRVLHFSNPSVNYMGKATGTAQQDNARSINNVRTTVANFRDSTSSCPTAVALRDVSEANAITDTLYAFRDKVMGSSDTGRSYTSLFYFYAAEGSRLLVKDARLRAKVRDLLIEVSPTLQAAVEGRDAALTSAELAALEDLMDSIAAKGSRGLSWVIRWLKSRIRSESFLAGFGLRIEDGA